MTNWFLVVFLVVVTYPSAQTTFVEIVDVESDCVWRKTCSLRLLNSNGDHLLQFNASATHHDGQQVIEAVKSKMNSKVTLTSGDQCQEMMDSAQGWAFAVCNGNEIYGHSLDMSEILYFSSKQGHHVVVVTDGKVSHDQLKTSRLRRQLVVSGKSSQFQKDNCNRRLLLMTDAPLYSVFKSDTIKMVDAVLEILVKSQAHFKLLTCRLAAIHLQTALAKDKWQKPDDIYFLLKYATNHIKDNYYETIKYDSAILISGQHFTARHPVHFQTHVGGKEIPICNSKHSVGTIMYLDQFGNNYSNNMSSVHLTYTIGRLMGIGADSGACKGLMTSSDGLYSYDNQKWSECSQRDLIQRLKNETCFSESPPKQCPRLCNGRSQCNFGSCQCANGFIPPECYRPDEAATTSTSTTKGTSKKSTPMPSTTVPPSAPDTNNTQATRPSGNKSTGLGKNTIILIAVVGTIGVLMVITVILVAIRNRKKAAVIEVERPPVNTNNYGGGGAANRADDGQFGPKKPKSNLAPGNSGVTANLPAYVPSRYYGAKPEGPKPAKLKSDLDLVMASYIPSKMYDKK